MNPIFSYTMKLEQHYMYSMVAIGLVAICRLLILALELQ